MLRALLLDIEVAFLNGDLEEEIYMECPKGIDAKADEALLLLKSMYGLVQAARQFFLKFTQILKKVGFTQSQAETCLFYKKMKLKVIVMIIHVDDCYVIGDVESIEDVVKDIEKEGLKIKVNYDTSDFLSFEIMFDKEKKKTWIGQTHLMKMMEQKFNHLAKDKQTYKTPGTPHQGIVRPIDGENKISEEDQKTYISGVGTLLQFIKYSRPDVANAVRELSKCMDGATRATFKEMCRLIKFVLDTKDLGLKIQP